MGTMTWWILGAVGAVALGGSVYYLARDGEKKPVAEVCLKDLAEPMFSSVKKAMDNKDVAALNAYAVEAYKKGWTCAGNELSTAAESAKRTSIDPAIAKLCIDDLPEPMRSDVKTAIAANDFAKLNTIALSIAFSGGGGCALDEVKAAATAAKKAVDAVDKTPDPVVDAPGEPTADALFDIAKTYNASSPRGGCITFYNALSASEKSAIQNALNAYRNGDAYYAKGTTSYLAEVADDFQTRGDWGFANCLRTQAGLPLRFPEVEPEGGGGGLIADGG